MISANVLGRATGFAAAVGIGMLATAAPARAALVSCPASFTTDGTAKVHDGTADKDTAASACQYLSPADASSVANEETVNDAEFFGFDDWEITAVDEFAPASGQSGTWAIPSPNFLLYDYMITFKDGANTNLISFLFNELFISGGWDTPFVSPPFSVGEPRDVSHFSIFRRLGDTPPPPNGDPAVPEPATLVMLGTGLVGLAARARSRRKKQNL